MGKQAAKVRMGKRGLFHRTALAVLFVLSGCAHAPRFETAGSGQLPTDVTPTFGFGSFAAGEDDALRARIADCLKRKGLATADKPAFLVQLAVSNTPSGTSVLSGADATASAPANLVRRSRRQSLVVTLSEIASGREVYRLQVVQPYRRTTARQPLPVLAEEACAIIDGSRLPAQHS
ncbi:hypothetical protein [Flavisphingomonas formosensis]|uniref:hypothetical protein n=1 Tax=Flavisphingomonas formosensis TaxID=861534 RepID=UPI0012F7172F|nr:hypothetical protein [Sphingomonas formosensis]